jgi:hypothetical protein
VVAGDVVAGGVGGGVAGAAVARVVVGTAVVGGAVVGGTVAFVVGARVDETTVPCVVGVDVCVALLFFVSVVADPIPPTMRKNARTQAIT